MAAVKSNYTSIFGVLVPSEAISSVANGPRKILLSGYTQNLLLNDPAFCQLFILLFLLSAITGVANWVRKVLLRERLSEIDYQRSALFKLQVFLFNFMGNSIEASLLTIFTTALILARSWEIRREWDLWGFSFLLFAVVCLALITTVQHRYVNRRFRSWEEIQLVEQIADSQIYDLSFIEKLRNGRAGGGPFAEVSTRFSLTINYHFIGSMKKLLLFLAVVVLSGHLLV